jgi:hypothetical protein
MALLLHQQLAVYKKTLRRPKLHPSDRLFWICLSRLWAEWRQALIIVTPDTVLRWHRRRFRDQWAKLSRGRKVGRPSINAEIVALVRKMAAANPLWGAPRIHGELPKLRIDVAERTVSRLIPKRPAALPDLAHVPHEPCPGSSLDRLLHSHRSVAGALRPGHPRSPLPPCPALQRHRASHRGLDRSADRGQPHGRPWPFLPLAIETPSTATPSDNA